MKTCLIDTGPFVAYLDRRDPAHDNVARFLGGFKGRLITTGAVVNEVMYFMSEFPNGPVAFANLLVASTVEIADFVRPAQILKAAELMEKYADTPMDFADATLVIRADEVGVTDILTLDRRGFSTYRTKKEKAFRLVV